MLERPLSSIPDIPEMPPSDPVRLRLSRELDLLPLPLTLPPDSEDLDPYRDDEALGPWCSGLAPGWGPGPPPFIVPLPSPPAESILWRLEDRLLLNIFFSLNSGIRTVEDSKV